MIEAQNLTKYYGDFIGIEDVTFKVNKGEIWGFLGPNGAGKTTAMRILTGFMPPTSGIAKVAGYDVTTQSLEARRHIGYMPETVPLYPDMTVKAYLSFRATLTGMDKKRKNKRIEEVIVTCGLRDYVDALISKLSKGFRQRVGIAQAILHEPDVLILDEPTIGLDPLQVVETRQLIKSLGKEHTVLLSTHILPEAAMICEKVMIINEGRIVAMDRPENLSTTIKGSDQVVMEIRGPAREVMSKLREVKGVRDVTREGSGDAGSYTVDCRPGQDLRQELAALVVNNGWGLLGIQSKRMSLEEIFLKLTTTEEVG